MANSLAIRRGLFGLSGFVLAFLTTCAQAGVAETPRMMARGIVFDDRGALGERRTGDAGVPGVLVSNGRRVTRSDSQGRYEIPIEPGCVIFVIKPAGWSMPTDAATGLPRLYRIHDPQDMRDPMWPGAEAAAPLPESLDFPLRRNPATARADEMATAATDGR